MNLLVISPGYPNNENIYNCGFVHRRVVEYKKRRQYQVQVIVHKKSSFTPYEYIYDGVKVNVIPRRLLKDYIINYKPHVILIHFYNYWMVDFLCKLQIPIIIWIHGEEGMMWYRRLFNAEFSMDFFKKIFSSSLRITKLKQLILHSNKGKNIHFVFVSEWMKRISEKDARIPIKNFSIIPNPIDTELFNFEDKDVKLRKNILMIRSFNSKKYANDIAINAIIELNKNRFFQDFTFNIYGDGKLFDTLTSKLKQFKNVILHREFIHQRDIPDIHKKHGIFLCPTRQDSQGVSMCEAMSSGLIPITSLNTAIPEFVKDGESGFLTKSSSEIASKILYIYENPKVFLRMSKQASKSIEEKAGKNKIIDSELEMIINIINKKI